MATVSRSRRIEVNGVGKSDSLCSEYFAKAEVIECEELWFSVHEEKGLTLFSIRLHA